jgi:peptidoglycan hydrolase-like protein with peptidoglycan-binding domain
VHAPTLALGSRGPSVLALEQRLHELHYALSTVDSIYQSDTRDAVYAFQKVNGLPRTGSVDATVWRRLLTATVPKARFPGDHIEVDKTRQVLFVVRGGEVQLVVAVSTGATGNTPLGRWHVYSKVPGYNAKLMYYSSFFIGGFAIHGYHDVPPFPASHGCVRVPLWVATRLYAIATYGTEVDIYL